MNDHLKPAERDEIDLNEDTTLFPTWRNEKDINNKEEGCTPGTTKFKRTHDKYVSCQICCIFIQTTVCHLTFCFKGTIVPQKLCTFVYQWQGLHASHNNDTCVWETSWWWHQKADLLQTSWGSNWKHLYSDIKTLAKGNSISNWINQYDRIINILLFLSAVWLPNIHECW